MNLDGRAVLESHARTQFESHANDLSRHTITVRTQGRDRCLRAEKQEFGQGT